MNRTGLIIALTISVIFGVLFALHPELDLKIAALFYDAVTKTFPLKASTWAVIARDGAMWIAWSLVAPAIVAFVVKLIRPVKPLMMSGRAMVFLLVTMLLTAIVLSNVVFKGYWGMPEKTKAELRENGFFITGDIGRVDEDGYVHIVGRAKDLIISGGLNIYPKEIEMLLDEQPGVLESAVVGVPHPDFGEAVLAFIVPKPGQEPDLAAITKFSSEHLARFKQPRELILLAELPRNTMGKVQKSLLRETYNGRFG